MKKILALLLTAVMSFTALTGCSDPVYDDFESFLNAEMTDVNANYDKIKAEAGTWGELEDDAALEASLKDVLLPIVEDSLDKLEKITPATEEVKAVKDKYVKVMETYKDAFSDILVGVQTQDEDVMTAGSEKLDNGIALPDEYNAALEALAEQVGAEIEY